MSVIESFLHKLIYVKSGNGTKKVTIGNASRSQDDSVLEVENNVKAEDPFDIPNPIIVNDPKDNHLVTKGFLDRILSKMGLQHLYENILDVTSNVMTLASERNFNIEDGLKKILNVSESKVDVFQDFNSNSDFNFNNSKMTFSEHIIKNDFDRDSLSIGESELLQIHKNFVSVGFEGTTTELNTKIPNDGEVLIIDGKIKADPKPTLGGHLIPKEYVDGDWFDFTNARVLLNDNTYSSFYDTIVRITIDEEVDPNIEPEVTDNLFSESKASGRVCFGEVNLNIQLRSRPRKKLSGQAISIHSKGYQLCKLPEELRPARKILASAAILNATWANKIFISIDTNGDIKTAEPQGLTAVNFSPYHVGYYFIDITHITYPVAI